MRSAPTGYQRDMTATGNPTTSRRQGSPRVLAWMVLAASVLEVLAPLITINGPGSSPGNGSGPELLITPVGWAFSIWGVIYTLAIVQAIAVLVRPAGAVSRRLQIDQLVLYLGGTLWIVLAGLGALIGIAVTGRTAGTTQVTVVAVTSAVILVAATVALRLSGRHLAATASR